MEQTLLSTIRADLARNPNRTTRLFLVVFRIGQFIHRRYKRPSAMARIFWLIPYVAITVVYRLLCHSFGCYMPVTVELGKGVFLRHGMYGVFISCGTRIGENATLLHNVTIGKNIERDDAEAPYIGDRVFIGVGAVIIGPIKIGDDAKIGANATVVTDIPAGATAVSPKATILERRGVARSV